MQILFFPFGYRAEVMRGRQRIPRSAIFRTSGPVLIEQVDEFDLEIAYHIEELHGRHRRCFNVFRHRGRLFWPLFNPSRSGSFDERQTLKDALNGDINLFGENLLAAAPLTLDEDICRVDWSDEKTVHLDMQRKAQDCLLVGDRLFATGGVPIMVSSKGRLRVVSTGASRSAEPAVSGLALQPGYHAEFWADRAICSGKCYLPGSPGLADEIRRLLCPESKIPVIEAMAAEDVDFFDLRVDAAFRLVDRAMFDRVWERPKLYDDLCECFERARDQEPAKLTRRRITALGECMKVFGADWMKQTFSLQCSRNILHLVRAAEPSGDLSTEDDLLVSDGELSAGEYAAIEMLFGASGA